MRLFQLSDTSGSSIMVTLWDKRAENFSLNNIGSVVRLRTAKVTEFGRKGLTVNQEVRRNLYDFVKGTNLIPKNIFQFRQHWTSTHKIYQRVTS
jgi:hypothetical protein